jgi:hypothetical protein
MPPLGRILAGTGFLGLTCRLPLTYREGMVEFGILGPLEITAGGQPLPVQGARTRAVLAMLLVHANQVVPADRLTGELWAGQPAAGAAASLQVRVSQLRKVLRPSGEAGRLVTRPPGYLIRVAPDELDAPRFERLARDGRPRWPLRTARARSGVSMTPWPCGAARPWPTWTTRRSRGRRRPGWRKGGWRRWSRGPRRCWPAAVTRS